MKKLRVMVGAEFFCEAAEVYFMAAITASVTCELYQRFIWPFFK